MGRLLIQFPGSTNAKVSNETLPKNTIVIDEDNKQLRLHDGVTRGGFPIGDRGGTSPATTDLDNLTMTGRNIGNWSTNVSNCVTEVPQDINLELADGVLTLKSGSKLHLAYGNLENTSTVDADISITNTYDGEYVVIRNSTTSLYLANITGSFSGVIANRPTTLSVSTGLYFATDENKMYLTGNSGTDWYDGSNFSLPLGIVTVSNGAISSIDQVFNGCGYIGSTRFYLPGVKGRIPDGINADGTLKTQEYTVPDVNVYTLNGPANIVITCGSERDNYGPYYEQVEKPNTGGLWYNPETNILLRSTDAGATWIRRNAFVLGNLISGTDGKISSFHMKQPFHAVDSNDVEFIINTVFKKVSALPSSPDPNTWYAIPE
jgi:hypothetical protein